MEPDKRFRSSDSVSSSFHFTRMQPQRQLQEKEEEKKKEKKHHPYPKAGERNSKNNASTWRKSANHVTQLNVNINVM